MLSPLSLADFIGRYVGQQYVVVRGTPGKFRELITWDRLDQALASMRIADGRVSLVRNSRLIDRERFVRVSADQRVQYVIGPAVSRLVAEGATLVVNQVDEIFPEVRALAESCEDVFNIYTAANLYAGWRRDNGFDVHWDKHDTLIVQVVGNKDWEVWRPADVPPPAEEVVWSGTLEQGDMLYIPRGWWHVAHPRDEPTLHVTLGLNHPTAADLLQWTIRRTASVADLRMSVPHWKGEADQAEWLASVREACAAAITNDIIREYMGQLAERMPVRPMVHLPRTKPATTPVIAADTALRLCHGPRLNLQRRGSTLYFRVRGKEWTCKEALAPALSLLRGTTPCTLGQMHQAVADDARTALRPFLLTLVLAEVVWADAAAAEPASVRT